jgi:hypothetical protein
MGDNLSKERINTLVFCLEGEEEDLTMCGCGYSWPHPPSQNTFHQRDLMASSLDCGRLDRANAMNLDPPCLVKKIMVEILLSAENNPRNRVTVPFSEEPLFSKLELLIATQRMELLSLETITLRPSTPRPPETQDLVISATPVGMALPGHTLPMEIRAQIH